MVPGYFSLEIQAMQLKGFTPKWLHQQCIYIVVSWLRYEIYQISFSHLNLKQKRFLNGLQNSWSFIFYVDGNPRWPQLQEKVLSCYLVLGHFSLEIQNIQLKGILVTPMVHYYSISLAMAYKYEIFLEITWPFQTKK